MALPCTASPFTTGASAAPCAQAHAPASAKPAANADTSPKRIQTPIPVTTLRKTAPNLKDSSVELPLTVARHRSFADPLSPMIALIQRVTQAEVRVRAEI